MSKLRMRTTTNSYIPVIHRMFYILELQAKRYIWPYAFIALWL